MYQYNTINDNYRMLLYNRYGKYNNVNLWQFVAKWNYTNNVISLIYVACPHRQSNVEERVRLQ